MENEKQKEIRYFSMFTGVGGFELGLENARSESNLSGRRNENSRSTSSLQSEGNQSRNEGKYKCIGFSEIDKYANQLLANKFPNVKNYGDATKINPNELPDFDMLCGGFPCQSFSIAGKRRGFEDTRGTMFFEIARILEVKRPRLVFLENVKGLLNHNKGETFKVILQTLEELGYEIQWVVLNSKFFGVPQNRERVFIIGSLRGESRPEILPFRTDNKNFNEQNEQRNDIAHTIQTGDKARGSYIKGDSQGMRVYDTNGTSSTLAGNAGGLGGKTGLYCVGNYTYNTRKRKTDVNEEEISEYLKQVLIINNLSKKQIANKLNLPFTQVEHYFRGKGIKGIALPDDKIWIQLKSILNFNDTYDKQMTEYIEYITNEHQGNRIYSDGESPTLSGTTEPIIAIPCQNMLNIKTRNIVAMRGRNPDNPSDRTPGSPTEQRLEVNENGTSNNLTSVQKDNLVLETANCLDANYWKGNSPSHRNQKRTRTEVSVGMKIRRLTPIECERLQGFPDGWTEGFSDTQRYKMMGNAVTVNVIKAIAEKLI